MTRLQVYVPRAAWTVVVPLGDCVMERTGLRRRRVPGWRVAASLVERDCVPVRGQWAGYVLGWKVLAVHETQVLSAISPVAAHLHEAAAAGAVVQEEECADLARLEAEHGLRPDRCCGEARLAAVVLLYPGLEGHCVQVGSSIEGLSDVELLADLLGQISDFDHLSCPIGLGLQL